MLDEFGHEKMPTHQRMLKQARQRQDEVLLKNQERWEKERCAATGGLFAVVAPWAIMAACVVGGLHVVNNSDPSPQRTSQPNWEEKVRPEGPRLAPSTVIEETVIAETHVEQITLDAALNVEELTP